MTTTTRPAVMATALTDLRGTLRLWRDVATGGGRVRDLPARARPAGWGCGLALSSAALALADLVTTSRPVSVVVLLAAGAVVSAVRFAMLRQSRHRRHLEARADVRDR